MSSITQGGIYIIKGPNDGIYVGSAVKFQKRWTFHRSLLRRGIHHSPHLQHAWDKYGETCLTFEIVEIVTDMDQLYAIEQRWLDTIFATVPRSRIYNVTRSADGATGRKPTAETLAKLSALRKGVRKSNETRQRMSAGRKGMRFTPGHCDNNALAKSGGKRYIVIAPDGTVYTDVVNLAAFAREYGAPRAGLANQACGNSPAAGGWSLAVMISVNHS